MSGEIALAAGACAAPAAAQRLGEPLAALFEDGNHAERQSRRDRDSEGEKQSGRIDRNLFEARQPSRAQPEDDFTTATANPAPRAPPISARARLSASISRAIRPRPAPSAARIANSCERPSARTRSRFATLAQAINNTAPIVAITTQRLLPISPIRSSRSRRIFGPRRASSNICLLSSAGAGMLLNSTSIIRLRSAFA